MMFQIFKLLDIGQWRNGKMLGLEQLLRASSPKVAPIEYFIPGFIEMNIEKIKSALGTSRCY